MSDRDPDHRNEMGDACVHVAAVRDLSERRAAANALDESEERFRKVFDESPIGLAVVDGELRMLQVNAALARMLEYGPDELTRLSYADVFLPEDLHADAEAIRDLLDGGTHIHQLEKRYVAKSGPPIWVQLTASVLKQPPGSPTRRHRDRRRHHATQRGARSRPISPSTMSSPGSGEPNPCHGPDRARTGPR